MSNSFESQFDLPFERKVGNLPAVMLPVLTTRDFLLWLSDMAKERRGLYNDLANTEPNLKPVDRLDAKKRIVTMDWSPDDLRPMIWTAAGTIRILEMALAKAGIAKDQIDAYIDAGSPKRNLKDAFRASGLFSSDDYLAAGFDTPAVEQDKEEAKDTNSPNPPSPAMDKVPELAGAGAT